MTSTPAPRPVLDAPSKLWGDLPPTRRQQMLGRAMVILIRDPIPPDGELRAAISGVPLMELAELAAYHRLAGLVYQRLGALEADDPAVAALADAYLGASAQNLSHLAELSRLAQIAERVGSPWLLVKGPVLAQLAYGDPGQRSSLDLDIVVSPRAFPELVQAIEEDGGLVLQRNWPLLERLLLGELVVRLPLGTLGDIHWHLVNTPFARARYRLAMSELFERRCSVSLGPLTVQTLEPTDTLLHLCVHAALSGGNQLVWLKDIERSLATTPPDWDLLVSRAERYDLGLATALLLERARVLLHADVPHGVVARLAPRNALIGAISAWDRRSLAHWARPIRTGKLLVAATAASTTSTIASLVRRVPPDVLAPAAAKTLRRLRVGPSASGERRGDGRGRPASPSVLTEPAGGLPERRRYFDAIRLEADRDAAVGHRRGSA